MKITMTKNELAQINGVMKNIFDKAVSELEIATPIDTTSFDAMLEVFETQEVIESPTATISVVGEEITIEVKPEFITDYLNLLNEVSSDAIEFIAKNKVVLMIAFKSLKGFFLDTVKVVVMHHLAPVAEPAKEFFESVKKKFMAFAEKMI